MGHYEPGNKGKFVLGLLGFFIMFILLLIYVYNRNGDGLTMLF